MRAWVAKKKAAKPGGMKIGYDQATRLAIYRYHKTSNALEARTYLAQMFDRLELKNQTRREQALDNLRGYVRWRKASDLVFVQDRLRIALDLRHGVIIGGEIPVINLDPEADTYLAVILGETAPNWKSQLRMPLLQAAVADRLSRQRGDVYLGIQGLDGGDLQLHQFSGAEIQGSLDDVSDLVARAQRLLSQ